MRRLAAIVLALGRWQAAAAETAVPADRFCPIAVYVDPGDAPLAAYQIEVTVGDPGRGAKVVGVEGGADPFRTAPYYDPAALQQGRIVIAAFTTEPGVARGRVQVATLHFFEPAGWVPEYRARLVVAVALDASGVRDVAATVALEPRGSAA